MKIQGALWNADDTLGLCRDSHPASLPQATLRWSTIVPNPQESIEIPMYLNGDRQVLLASFWHPVSCDREKLLRQSAALLSD